jgi:hypothetical protein
VAVETRLPDAGRARVAVQVRQDLWRALRHQKGFQPAVRVVREAGGLTLCAGGAVAAPHDRRALEERIAALLAEPRHRARWVSCARGRRA